MALTGAVLGDIAGSRFENCWKPFDWEHVELFAENCCYTDDTVMSLAVKAAVTEHRDFAEVMREMGRKYPDAGYGFGFYKWLQFTEQKPYGSYGNGAAMRVAFLADYYEDLENVKEAARRSAAVSHDHPEGIKGAEATAVCIWMANHGKSKRAINEYMLSQYPPKKYNYSGRDLNWLRQNATFSTSCQGSVPVAVRCFLECDGFESFMRNVFSIQCDRDTIGAIGGGMVEGYYNGFPFDAEAVLERYLTPELLEIVQRGYIPCGKKKQRFWKG